MLCDIVNCIFNILDKISILAGIATTIIAVRAWCKLKKHLGENNRIKPVVGSYDVVIVLDVINKGILGQVNTFLESAGESYLRLLSDNAIKRHLDFNEKNKEFYPGNSFFDLKYVYTSGSNAYAEQPKGRVIEINAAPGHEEMPFENKDLELYILNFRSMIKNTLKSLRGSGVSHLHLFMAVPIPLASIIGSELDNNFKVSLYHRDKNSQEYYLIGKLQV